MIGLSNNGVISLRSLRCVRCVGWKPGLTNHSAQRTYDSERPHEAGESRDAEAVPGEVEQAAVERAPARHVMTSQHARTVSLSREQRLKQAAQIAVVTATHRTEPHLYHVGGRYSGKRRTEEKNENFPIILSSSTL